MINLDRIVPITATDLLSLYALILKVAGVTITAAETAEPGVFEIEEAPESGSIIANEPVKTLDFASGVSAATVYFVPAYDYAGFTVNGAAVTTTGDDVEADGCSLYLATLSSGAVSIEAKGV